MPSTRSIALMLTILLIPSPVLASSAVPNPYAAQLIQQAAELALSHDPTWRALLHYPTWPVSDSKSSMEDPHFFLSDTGMVNPEAELVATLLQFFDAPTITPRDNQHAQCLFNARYQWLKKQLHFDSERLAEQPCQRVTQWLTALAPVDVSLIFPEAYMNNPSSMFGHTLLRIDGHGQEEGTRLLAYALNFEASTGDDGGVAFAWKGLTGGYTGKFSLLPYYDKVTEYSDWENRDIWEYRLHLEPEELNLLMRHIWELRDIKVRYYFFTRNCSYELLGLLEVARPGTAFQRRFMYHAIPVDTIRAVIDVPGLVDKEVTYRPSPNTRLRHGEQEISSDMLQQSLAMVDGTLLPDNPAMTLRSNTDKAKILEMAYNILRFRFLDNTLDQDAARLRSRQILLSRSRIDQEQILQEPNKPRISPELGHSSSRFQMGTGWQHGRLIHHLGIRPAFHDLLDAQGGYTAGAHINFMDLTLNFNPKTDKAKLESLHILDIISLAPMGKLFKSPSWHLRTSIEQLAMMDAADTLQEEPVWRSQGGAGVTYRLPYLVWFYAMAEGEALVSPHLQHDFALGVGPAIGLLIGDDEDTWRANIMARSQRFFLGHKSTQREATVTLSVPMDNNHALRLETSWREAFETEQTLSRLSWVRYF